MIDARIFDSEGDLIERSVTFELTDSETGTIVASDDKRWFVASNPGQTEIKCKALGAGFWQSKTIKVLSPSDKMRILFTAKTEEGNIFPLQSVDVGLTDLNSYVENRQSDYAEIYRHTLAHAILQGLQKASVNLSFRDDVNSNGKLYLYSVENDGFFTYGWGGKINPQPFAKAWIARLNNHQYLNDFDKLKISEGDTIVLYHVTDITNSWIFSQFIPDKITARKGDQIQFKLEETSCSFQNGTVTETDFAPVENAEINAGLKYFTNEFGEVKLTLESSSPWIISSGNNAVLIKEETVTNSDLKGLSFVNVFPNPVENELHFSGAGITNTKIILYHINGEQLLVKIARSDNDVLDMKTFSSGIYLLKLIQNGTINTFKIIKK